MNAYSALKPTLYAFHKCIKDIKEHIVGVICVTIQSLYKTSSAQVVHRYPRTGSMGDNNMAAKSCTLCTTVCEHVPTTTAGCTASPVDISPPL